MAPHATGIAEERGANGTTHTNGFGHTNGSNGTFSNGTALSSNPAVAVPYVQDPVAVVSMACRLPDECSNPRLFWKFLSEGKIAMNTPPGTRFDINTQYDGSLKPQTMASPGGMFLQNVDPRDIDAQFFKLSGIEATSMDPQQRQLLEVVYEGLENGGVTLEQVSGAPVGCFVSSFASDYGDIQARDPENRASATAVGVGRAMLSNRISHFLNTKGPSYVVLH
jgi:acyl transferase domain-containing protein